jgi:hydroxymethylpyrimidine/phosphomethylpyrimidine kinase
VSTSGSILLEADAVEVLKDELLPLATVITPNMQEAATLCGQPVLLPPFFLLLILFQ